MACGAACLKKTVATATVAVLGSLEGARATEQSAHGGGGGVFSAAVLAVQWWPPRARQFLRGIGPRPAHNGARVPTETAGLVACRVDKTGCYPRIVECNVRLSIPGQSLGCRAGGFARTCGAWPTRTTV